MNSYELAGEVERLVPEAVIDDRTPEAHAAVVEDAQHRILGVGAQQYTEGDQQKFETMPLLDLVEYAREETLDLVNYGVMLTLRIERLAEMVRAAEARLTDEGADTQ